MLQILGLLSAMLIPLCYAPYIKDIFALKTKPERASWFIWATHGSIAFFSQLAKGATDSLWLSGLETLFSAIVFLLSLKYGVGGFTKRDITALSIAGIGLILWSITKEPAIALFLVIIVDAAGAYVTIVKSYEDPESETLITWILAGTAGLLSALSVGSMNLILLSYPIYIVIANYLTAGAILLGKNHLKNQKRII
jgi:hypothetical protein